MRKTLAAHQWVPRAGLAVLSGLLLAAAFPPLDWGVVSWIALVPLFWVLRRATWRAGLCYGALTSLTFFLLFFAYILAYGFVPWFALSVWETVFIALAGALIALVGGRVGSGAWPWAAAALWTLCNFLRGNVGPLSLPFGELAYAQHDVPLVLQLASVSGMYGLTFLVALFNAAAADLLAIAFAARGAGPGERDAFESWAQAACRTSRWIGLVMIAAIVWGGVRCGLLGGVEEAPPSVAAVQGNVSAERGSVGDIRRSLRAYRALSERGDAKGAHLVVWPEGAIPGPVEIIPDVFPKLQQIARDLDAWLLFGAQRRGPDGRTYNAAILLAPDGEKAGEYDKNNLVLFGEYVPFRRLLGWAERYGAPRYDLTPGRERPILQTDRLRVGCLICFESLFPKAAREEVRQGADVLAIITSDGWAGETAEVWQHARVAQLRAVETGRYVIRAGDTGITCIIEPSGRIVAAIPPFRDGVVTGRVEPLTDMTLYMRWGDGPLIALCHVAFLIPVWVERRRRRRLASDEPDGDADARPEASED